MISPTLRSRIQFCAALAVIPSLAIGVRLFWLQTFRHEKLSETASREFNRTVSEIGPRGRIYDDNGDLLAQSIVTWDVSLSKRDLDDPARAVASLTRALSLPASFRERFRRARNFLYVKKGIGRNEYEAVKALGLKGVTMTPLESRYYPSGDIARSIIGVTSADKGLTGVELLYDKVLSGRVSSREIVRDAAGRVIFQGQQEKGSQPKDLHLTIDKNIQYFAQEAIRKVVDAYHADLGMALVQDPDSGAILAMASWPRNLDRIDPVEWVYEPGSTFKAVTLSAALETGTVSEKDSFFCENGAWHFNDKVIIHDHEPEKTLTIPEIMEHSSNIGMGKVALKVGINNFYLYVKAFGFGEKSGLGFAGESAGLLRPMDKFKPIELAVAAYGHGVAATPLQMLDAYSAIANGGRLYAPRLVNSITDADGKVLFANQPTVIRQAIKPETSRRVRAILRDVVVYGTGRNADIPGYSISGKTGTANKIDPKTGKYMTGRNVASFAGFFPQHHPQYTILVVVDNPKGMIYGGETAAPAFREIASKIITLKGIKPDLPITQKPAGRRAKISD